MTFSETLSPAPCEEDVKVACDLVGCRIARSHTGTAFAQPDAIEYAYNAKSELTNAVAVADASYTYAYDFDEIGNRRTSSECGVRSAEYAANELNQYTAISTDTSALFVSPREIFTPLFDADGNQTLVKTATGTWQVSYNGENRPILWTCGATNIVMSYDRMGRRVTKNDQRFVYDGYLCIGKFETSTPIHYNLSPIHCYVWDPTEPVATRPLAWFNSALATPRSALYYTHDGNKNVSEVIADNGNIAAHYEYAPFGAVTVQSGDSAANPWRFSSEFADDELGCDYYNYREYEPLTGRWMCMDPLVSMLRKTHEYSFMGQINMFDNLGLKECVLDSMAIDDKGWRLKSWDFGKSDAMNGYVLITEIETVWEMSANVVCKCWQWNWGWGHRCKTFKNTIVKTVSRSMSLPCNQQCVGYTPTGLSAVPNPTMISAVIGEFAGVVLSKVVSEAMLYFALNDAQMLSELMRAMKPTSLNEGTWPIDKCK